MDLRVLGERQAGLCTKSPLRVHEFSQKHAAGGNTDCKSVIACEDRSPTGEI